MKTLKMADAIYTECYPTVDDKRFRDAKTTEILDWLSTWPADDSASQDVTALVTEWREYDAEEIAANA